MIQQSETVLRLFYQQRAELQAMLEQIEVDDFENPKHAKLSELIWQMNRDEEDYQKKLDQLARDYLVESNLKKIS